MTPEELAKLTPEQKRIRIAELCGWQWEEGRRNMRKQSQRLVSPDHKSVCYVWKNDQFGGNGLPDYLHDLNAMHAAEKLLTCEQGATFMLRLIDLNEIDGANPHGAWHTTAAQRADAFLLVMG